MSRSLLMFVLLACNGSDDTDAIDTDADADTDADSDTDTDTDADGDEALVRALIAGERTPDEVVPAIAWSGGWPVKTQAGTVIFVHWTDSGSWGVAGDFSSWEPVAMTPGDGFQWAEVEVAVPAGQLYKLVEGDTWIADPWARSYGYDAFGEFSYVAPPTDAYRLDRWPDLEGQGLLPRDLRAYVPPGAGPWPVLYVHDGQNLFDPDAFWGGWRLQDAVATVGEDVLIVGIDNTADRMTDYTHTTDTIGGDTFVGEGDAYARLLHEDVRPHVEAVYGSTGHDGVMGSSLGGLISLYAAHLYPGDFDYVASLSGTLGWGRFGASNPVMEELYLAEGVRDFAIYVDSGGDDGGDGCADVDGDGFVEDDPNDGDNYCVNRAFADAMAGQGYAWDEDLWHWHEAGAGHDEAEWAARVHRPLGIFLGLD